MCGIAGIFAFDPNSPQINRDELGRTSGYIVSRGPDANGSWRTSDNSVALAHRRLSIIDLGRQGKPAHGVCQFRPDDRIQW